MTNSELRTWTDPDGDVWYNVAKNEWTLWGPDKDQPIGVLNLPTSRMRYVYPSFPY